MLFNDKKIEDLADLLIEAMPNKDSDSYLQRKKEIEIATGANVDKVIMDAVIYGATTVASCIQTGIDVGATPKMTFTVAGIMVADFLKLKKSLKKLS